MERECKSCGKVCVEIKQKGNHIGAYCKECGKWIKWLKKDELTANDEIKEIQTLIGKMGKELSGKGIGFISELIKEYGFSEVYKSVKIAIDTYYVENEEVSTKAVIHYIPRICANRRVQKVKPEIRSINYLVKIGINNLECFNELYRGKIRKILMENYTEEDFDELKTVFCNTSSQHELLDDLNIYYSLV